PHRAMLVPLPSGRVEGARHTRARGPSQADRGPKHPTLAAFGVVLHPIPVAVAGRDRHPRALQDAGEDRILPRRPRAHQRHLPGHGRPTARWRDGVRTLGLLGLRSGELDPVVDHVARVLVLDLPERRLRKVLAQARQQALGVLGGEGGALAPLDTEDALLREVEIEADREDAARGREAVTVRERRDAFANDRIDVDGVAFSQLLALERAAAGDLAGPDREELAPLLGFSRRVLRRGGRALRRSARLCRRAVPGRGRAGHDANPRQMRPERADAEPHRSDHPDAREATALLRGDLDSDGLGRGHAEALEGAKGRLAQTLAPLYSTPPTSPETLLTPFRPRCWVRSLAESRMDRLCCARACSGASWRASRWRSCSARA